MLPDQLYGNYETFHVIWSISFQMQATNEVCIFNPIPVNGVNMTPPFTLIYTLRYLYTNLYILRTISQLHKGLMLISHFMTN